MIAEFASSEHGKLYGRVCQQSFVDPAAGMDDDVLAYNFRLAMAVGTLEDEPEPEPTHTPGGGISYEGGIR